MATIAALIAQRAGDPSAALLFEDAAWSYAELAREAAARASLLSAGPGDGPPHVGVLLDNVPEFVFWLAAAALSRSVVVGINSTRRGPDLASDIRATDCRWLVTDSQHHQDLLAGLDLAIPPGRTLIVDTDSYAERLGEHSGAPVSTSAEPGDLLTLIFTSGTTGRPKAVRITQGRLARSGLGLTSRVDLSGGVVYQAMPLFHSNAVIAGWSPALVAGIPMAVRRRFSASGWLPDVRRYGATYFNYVGKPLAYMLATPEKDDDADNPLEVAFGNEANPNDIERFERRFGCKVMDAYGSSEGGAAITRTPGTPKEALGRVTDTVRVFNPATGTQCPPARFDDAGQVLNPDEAIGEIASTTGPAVFEGYYQNEEAEQQRVHSGLYCSGDLAYRDDDGWVYFTGRSDDWLRVDGENFGAASVEALIARHPDVMLVAVYAVPDPRVGDQVMACVQFRPGSTADARALDAHLRAQPELGTKWLPRFVRVTSQMPTTATAKVLKRQLRAERWECPDPVWWRPKPAADLRALTAADLAAIRDEFGRHGRTRALTLA
jgi:fatty-acyl-CoA synthase